MIEKVKKLFLFFLDFLLPERRDFATVRKLTPTDIDTLPKAPNVTGMDWIHPLFHYKDSRTKAIIWELKYKENTLPLDYIGKLLYEEILGVMSDVSLFDGDAHFILLPIPITPTRRAERGYNQAEYIAKAVLENDIEHILLYAPQWFQKIKDTPRQSHSESKQERISNLKDSFEASPNVEGKYAILIDDVVTTGSTLSEVRNTLLASRAKDVFAFTIAH